LNRIKARIKFLPYCLVGELLERLDEAKASLVSADEILRNGQPHAICPKCDGQGCFDCRNAGYVTAWRLAEMRQHEKLAG
jgi:hypothetical protein